MPAISGRTKIVGLFGDPVEHSLSPAMHNAAFAKLGLPYVYIPFHVLPDELPHAVKAIVALSLTGVNVTVPHKETIIPYLGRLDDSALRCGAVNTVVRNGSELIGYNTDGTGFVDSLRAASLDPRQAKVVILGAGGSARAIAAQLLQDGASKIIILNRTMQRANTLAQTLNEPEKVEVLPLDNRSAAGIAGADLVVNTLSVPFRSNGDWLIDLSSAIGALFYDLRYGAMPADFLVYAKELNSPSLDGRSMLLFQGARAFSLFCGREAPLDIMRESLAGKH